MRSFFTSLPLIFGLATSLTTLTTLTMPIQSLHAAEEQDPAHNQRSPEAIAHADPAHIIVRPEVIAKNPGAYTFTSYRGPVNGLIMAGNFEPFSRRTKIHAAAASANEIITTAGKVWCFKY